jgi:hypothetical protein
MPNHFEAIIHDKLHADYKFKAYELIIFISSKDDIQANNNETRVKNSPS